MLEFIFSRYKNLDFKYWNLYCIMENLAIENILF